MVEKEAEKKVEQEVAVRICDAFLQYPLSLPGVDHVEAAGAAAAAPSPSPGGEENRNDLHKQGFQRQNRHSSQFRLRPRPPPVLTGGWR